MSTLNQKQFLTSDKDSNGKTNNHLLWPSVPPKVCFLHKSGLLPLFFSSNLSTAIILHPPEESVSVIYVNLKINQYFYGSDHNFYFLPLSLFLAY